MNDDVIEAKRLYNKQAQTYSSNQMHYAPVQDFKQSIFTYLGNLKGKKILFTGCADGYECVPAMEQGADVVGIDVSDTFIEIAKGRYPEAQFFVMDQAALEFSDTSFDIIIALFSVMYTEDIEKLLSEFRRVLKQDGKIVIAVPHPVRKMVKYNAMNYFVKGKQYENWKGVARYNYYRLFEDYVDAFVASGLKLAKLMEPKPIKEFEAMPDADVSHPYFLILVLIPD